MGSLDLGHHVYAVYLRVPLIPGKIVPHEERESAPPNHAPCGGPQAIIARDNWSRGRSMTISGRG